MAALLIEDKPHEAFEYFSIAASFIASLVSSLLFTRFSASSSNHTSSLDTELLPRRRAVMVSSRFSRPRTRRSPFPSSGSRSPPGTRVNSFEAS